MSLETSPADMPSHLAEELERSRQDLEDFFENGAVALHWVASDGSILRVNQAELDLLGYAREEYVGHQIAEFHADPPVIQDILDRLSRGEKLDKYEARLRAKNGSIKHVLISSNVHFREGKFINTRCFTLDVTNLKRAESRQKILLDEINHRVKNMLATVQSVAMQTRRTATDLNAYTEAFEGRLLALNRAHELLTRDIEIGVLVRDLVRDAAGPHEPKPGDRFRIAGPSIRLSAEIAVTLAMALHELATNAAKYGALSCPQGRIDVEWHIETQVPGRPEHMVFEWSEHNGPPVAQPGRRGFGANLIERGLARQFGGKAALEFHRDGLLCHIAVPIPRVWEGAA